MHDFGKISLGALNGALGIDAALSALETDGKVQVLLKPRVVTQNNIKATITRGEEIPYTTLTAVPQGGDGVSIIQQVPQVSFKVAALTLAVLPRISASGTVILEVDVDNGSRGTVQANGNTRSTRSASRRRVLVKDQGDDRHRRHLRDARDAQTRTGRPACRACRSSAASSGAIGDGRTKANCSCSLRRASSRAPRQWRHGPTQ